MYNIRERGNTTSNGFPLNKVDMTIDDSIPGADVDA
jgi:hypothetical protein